jgi:hypothetical protein
MGRGVPRLREWWFWVLERGLVLWRFCEPEKITYMVQWKVWARIRDVGCIGMIESIYLGK